MGLFALVLMLGFSQQVEAAAGCTQIQGNLSLNQPYGKGTVNQRLIYVKVTPSASGIVISNFTFTITGYDQISKLLLYGSSNNIPDPSSTGNYFGTAITNPTATASFDGTFTTGSGSYTFYLLADIKPDATVGEIIDATCISVNAGVDGVYTNITTTDDRNAVIADNLTGVKTVGSAGDYTTLNLAIAAINNYGVGTGGVTFNVAAGETIPASKLDYNYYLIRQSGTATNPIVFQKSGDGAKPIISIAGSSSSSDCFFGAMGVNYLTLDGLDFRATGTATQKFEKSILFVTIPGHGCSHNEIKNCVIDAAVSTASATSVWGITFQSKATTAGETNSYNKIHHNTITNTDKAIDFGTSSTTPTANDTGNEIYNNTINGGFNTAGIFLKYCTDTKVYNNVIDGGATASTISRSGIDGGSSTNTGYIDCYGNTIKNISINAAQTLSGISLFANTVNIYNNVIANISNNFTTAHTKGTNGILMGSNATLVPTYNIYHNSIYINQTAVNTTARTTCIAQESSYVANVAAMNLINNICVNTSNAGEGGSTANYTLYIPNTAAKLGATTDNNLYFPETTIRTGSSNNADLAAYKSAVSAAGIEQNSVTGDPLYVGAATGDLSIINVLSPANNKGKPLASVTKDIADNDRSEYKPDMGAYEFDKFSTSVLKLNEKTAQIYSQNGQIIANLSAENQATTVTVIDTKGTVLKTVFSNGAELLSIPVSSKGIYMVRIQNGQKNLVKKVVLF